MEATATDQSKVRVYVDVDKNPRQLFVERVGRAIVAVLRERFPAWQVALRKVDATVLVNGAPLARVTSTDRDKFNVQWQRKRAGDLGCDASVVERCVGERLDSVAGEPWG